MLMFILYNNLMN